MCVKEKVSPKTNVLLTCELHTRGTHMLVRHWFYETISYKIFLCANI